MRIGLDATPLLGARTGIGRYVAELVRHLPTTLQDGDELVATAFTVRGAGGLRGEVPPGVSVRSRRVPARALHELWARTSVPTVGALAGRFGLFHGTNFVLPPVGRAAGVVTVHDLAYLHLATTVTPASRRYIELVPRSLRRAAVVCVPSQFVADQLQEAYPAAAGRIVVTPLGVDPGWAHAVAPSRSRLATLGVDREYLLFIGNLEPRKDVATAVAAYRRLVDDGRGDLPQLVLVGPEGWGGGIDLDGLPEKLVLRLGRRPEGELRSLVAGARAVLYPSRYEGFGLPVLESFACGTGLLASDIPTTREILGEQQDLAGLFPVGDSAALAELIAAEVDRRPETVRRRQELAAGWTWQRTAQATGGAYAQALS